MSSWVVLGEREDVTSSRSSTAVFDDDMSDDSSRLSRCSRSPC